MPVTFGGVHTTAANLSWQSITYLCICNRVVALWCIGGIIHASHIQLEEHASSQHGKASLVEHGGSLHTFQYAGRQRAVQQTLQQQHICNNVPLSLRVEEPCTDEMLADRGL
jgi:hypothetical protein